MPTEYRLHSVHVERPDKRRGLNADKPDAYMVLRILVGKRSKLTEIPISEQEALLLVEQVVVGLRRLRGQS